MDYSADQGTAGSGEGAVLTGDGGESLGTILKLHLGCGNKKIDGWVNIDASGSPDIVHDLTEPLPFPDGSADVICAFHVFEHFYRYDSDRILSDWVRVLKPGGVLVMEMPCLDKIIPIIADSLETKRPMAMRLTMWGLYGDPGHKEPAMMHRWCYSLREIGTMFLERGLQTRFAKPRTHVETRDMRIEGIK